MSIYKVIGSATGFTPDEQAAIQLPVRAAYDNLLRGPGCEEDFHTLAAAVNVAMICAEKIDQLVEISCVAARDAMMRLHARHQKLGSWGFDGPAIGQVELAVDVYEQLTSLLTGGQLKAAMSECIRRMKAGEVMQSGDLA